MDFSYKQITYLSLRVVLGLMFLYTGLNKLGAPESASAMLVGLGIPFLSLFGWLLVAIEVLSGLSLLIGWKVNYSGMVLSLLMILTVVLVVIPAASSSGNWTNIFFNLIVIIALKHVALEGSGIFSVGSKKKKR